MEEIEHLKSHSPSGTILPLFFFLYVFFLLDIFFIYISNVFPFSISPSKTPYPNPSPPPATMRVLPHPPSHFHLPARAFPYTGHWSPSSPKFTPPTDVQQGHPLPYMWPESWFPQYVLFGSWSRTQELWQGWGGWGPSWARNLSRSGGLTCVLRCVSNLGRPALSQWDLGMESCDTGSAAGADQPIYLKHNHLLK